VASRAGRIISGLLGEHTGVLDCVADRFLLLAGRRGCVADLLAQVGGRVQLGIGAEDVADGEIQPAANKGH